MVARFLRQGWRVTYAAMRWAGGLNPDEEHRDIVTEVIVEGQLREMERRFASLEEELRQASEPPQPPQPAAGTAASAWPPSLLLGVVLPMALLTAAIAWAALSRRLRARAVAAVPPPPPTASIGRFGHARRWATAAGKDGTGEGLASAVLQPHTATEAAVLRIAASLGHSPGVVGARELLVLLRREVPQAFDDPYGAAHDPRVLDNMRRVLATASCSAPGGGSNSDSDEDNDGFTVKSSDLGLDELDLDLDVDAAPHQPPSSPPPPGPGDRRRQGAKAVPGAGAGAQMRRQWRF